MYKNRGFKLVIKDKKDNCMKKIKEICCKFYKNIVY